jgi:uncharacterized membrane protein YecN with MAPEG domain
MFTPLYAAIFAIFFVFLSIRVIKQRRRNSVGIGNGDNIELSRAIRVHANFSEYVPFALVLLFLFETQTSAYYFSSIGVHFFGISLLIGRMIHAYGVSQVHENIRFRIAGMAITFCSFLLLALSILFTYLF